MGTSSPARLPTRLLVSLVQAGGCPQSDREAQGDTDQPWLLQASGTQNHIQGLLEGASCLPCTGAVVLHWDSFVQQGTLGNTWRHFWEMLPASSR